MLAASVCSAMALLLGLTWLYPVPTSALAARIPPEFTDPRPAGPPVEDWIAYQLLRYQTALSRSEVEAVACTIESEAHSWGLSRDLILAVMRTERGFFCMPEVDLGLPLHPGMTAIIQARVPTLTAHQMIVTGTRYGAELALEKGIVDAIAPEEEVVASAIAAVAPLAEKAHPAMSELKRGMYPHVLEALQGGRAD